MKAGEWAEAERDLQEAAAQDPKDPDTLANLVTVGLHLAKNVSRYAS
jgi:coatomer protein complex subunit epsilon